MAAFDQVWSNEGTGVSSLGVTSVAPAGTNRLLIVQYGAAGSTAFSTLTALTKGATSITTEQWNLTNPNYWRFTQRSLVNPSTTSETVTATCSGSQDTMSLGVMSFNGVDQTTPLDTPTTSNADSFNPAGISITSATNDIVVGGIVCGWHTGLTFEGAGTERYNRAGIGAYSNAAGSTAPGAATVNVEWGAGSGYNSAYIMGGVNINDDGLGGGGGGGLRRRGSLGLVGVGR